MATYMESEIPTVINTSGNNGSGFGYGNDAWVLIILFALIFGWGRNGNGFGGGNGGYDASAEIQRGFDNQSVLNKLNGLENGLCDGFYAQNTNILNGFAGVQQTLCQGFSGINSAINTSGYETRSAINDLGYRLQDCCCQTQRAIDGVNYNMAKNTCDILNTVNAGFNSIITNQNKLYTDFLMYDSNKEITKLRADNAALTSQLSQNSQTSTIINALSPKTPVPAYPVFAPNMSFAYPSGVSFGINGYGTNGCGCGSY